MLLQWSKDLAVGHAIIDSDHQMLINIANELDHSATSGAGQEAIGLALSRLVTYIETHFQREEALFLDSDYPHKDKHQKNHRDIEHLMNGFSQAYQTDPATVELDKLLNFLKEWLVQHIGILDKSYISHVKAVEKQRGQYNKRRGFA